MMSIWSLGIGILLMIFRYQVIGIYTNDAAVAMIAGQLIAYIAIYQFFDAQQAVTVAILRGYKKTTIPMVIFVSSLWGIGLGGGYIVGLHPFKLYCLEVLPTGARGFWLAEVVSIVIVVIFLFMYFHQVKTKTGGAYLS